MIFSDESFQLDTQGNRVLVGLTFEETKEFLLLDLRLDETAPSLSVDEWETPDQKRWLELYDKHEAAIKPFLSTHKTRH